MPSPENESPLNPLGPVEKITLGNREKKDLLSKLCRDRENSYLPDVLQLDSEYGPGHFVTQPAEFYPVDAIQNDNARDSTVQYTFAPKLTSESRRPFCAMELISHSKRFNSCTFSMRRFTFQNGQHRIVQEIQQLLYILNEIYSSEQISQDSASFQQLSSSQRMRFTFQNR